MQTDSNQASTNPNTNTINSLKKGNLLIPRNERRKFFLSFTSACILGWVIGGLVSIEIEEIIQNLLLSHLSLETQEFFKIYLTEAIFAIIFGCSQALVLKRYISGWLWFVATVVGWNLAKIVSNTWINYISEQASSFLSSLGRELSSNEMMLFAALSTIAFIVSGIWLGLCQWLVLRRYIVMAWRWIFVPSIAFSFISILVWLLSIVQDWLPFVYRPNIANWGGQGFTALILGIVPAVALCIAKYKIQDTANSRHH